MFYTLFPKLELRIARKYYVVFSLILYLILLVNSQIFSQPFPEINRTIIGPAGEYGRIPLHFEANQGQVDKQVQFLARGQGYNLYLANGEAILTLINSTVHMQLLGANPEIAVVEQERSPGIVNYFIGNDPEQWQTNIPTYAKVQYENVYPGIDLVYYGNQQQLEYDFVVQPNIDPNVIALRFEGATDLEIDTEGNLLITTTGGQITQQAPIIYQEQNGVRQMVDGGYVLDGNGRVRFQIADYNASLPLIIDPILVYATYLGGNDADNNQGLAVDSAGNAYVTGRTYSLDFPATTGSFDTRWSGEIITNL